MYAVENLVPHSGSMLLLDRVLEYGDDWLKAQVEIKQDSMFCENDSVAALVGIEYMAQAIAAFAGKNDKLINKKPSIGLLLGTRKYDSTVDNFPIGTVLNIHVQQMYIDDSGLGVFKCKIEAENILVEANINVYHPQDITSLL